MTRIVILASLSLILAAASVVAQETDTTMAKLKSFCSGDYLRLCAGMDPKGQKVVACFHRNMAQVSPGCRAAIEEYRDRAGAGAPGKS